MLDALATQRLQAVHGQAELFGGRLREGHTLPVSALRGALEVCGGHETATHEQAAEVLALPLHGSRSNQPLAEDDPARVVARAQQEPPRLPRQTDDLEDVGEAQILEAADQAHPALPFQKRARLALGGSCCAPFERNRPSGA